MLYSNNTTGFSVKHFYNVPLTYTFYKEFEFKQGDILSILSSSPQRHNVDILYLGEPNKMIYNPQDNGYYSVNHSEIANNAMSNQSDNPFDINPIPASKPILSYTPASSDEMQVLNWKGLSVKNPLRPRYDLTKNVKIPKTGTYLIRFRTDEIGRTGIVSAKINNACFNQPISYIYVDCSIPANGTAYGSMTFCNNPESDDPIMFMHGADADRIVGFGDDSSKALQFVHGLSKYDSHVLQQYHIPTTGISVSNYSSSNPESTCDILAGMDESLFDLPPEFLIQSLYYQNGDNMDAMNDNNISVKIDKCGVISVFAQDIIKKVTVTDISGRIMGSVNTENRTVSIAASSMNIKNRGIYIVTVEIEKGEISKMIVIE